MMNRFANHTCAAAILFAACLPLNAAEVVKVRPLPITPAQNPPVIDEKFGIKVVDEDRWLEDTKNPKVEQWYRDQNAYTRKVMDSIPGRTRILAEMESLEAAQSSKVNDVFRGQHGDMFVLRRNAGEQTGRLYVRDARSGNERLFVDPAEWEVRTGKPHSIEEVSVSLDGRHVVVAIAANGSELPELFVYEVASGRQTEGPIKGSNQAVRWLPDHSGFIYHHMDEVAPGTDPKLRKLNSQTFLHQLGTPQSADVAIIGTQSTPDLGLKPNELPVTGITNDGRWVISYAISVTPDPPGWIAPASDLEKAKRGGKVDWKPLWGRDSGNNGSYSVQDGYLYFLRTDAGRDRFVRLNLAHPERKPEAVTDAQGDPISDSVVTRDAIFMVARNKDAVTQRLLRYDLKRKKQTQVKVPRADSMQFVDRDAGVDEVLVRATGWSLFSTIFSIDGNRVMKTDLEPAPVGLDEKSVSAKVVEIASHDGTKVPLSILMPAGMKLDSSHPLLLSGYGAYGSPGGAAALPPVLLAYTRQGIVFATCHVRGGGERGETWHQAGQKANKANTWKDFIACGDWLVKQGYTSPDRLSGIGISAGGILIGNAMLARPDLFGSAFPNVGWLDTAASFVRDPNGPANWPEFGDPATEAGWKGIVAMSAYQKIKPGTAYPATLITAGWNDPRVAVWNSGKFAARLQRDSNSNKPVLLSVNFEGGHGRGTQLKARQLQFADQISFMLWQAGVPEFQPSWQGN